MSIFGKGDQLRSSDSGSGRRRGLDFLDRLFQYFKDRKDSKKWRAVIMSLAVVVVFLTTYGLILPAITMEKEKAQDMPGMHLASDSSHDEEMRTRGDPEPEDESVREEDVENKGSIESMDDSSSGQEKNGDDDLRTEKEGESQEKNEEPDRTTDQKEDAGKVEYMTGTLTCRTVGYEISVALEEEDRIPVRTRLTASVITKGDPDYKLYEDALQKKDARLTGQIYYQLRMTYQGKEIRPARPVDITFTGIYKNEKKVDYGVVFRKGKTGLKAGVISPVYEDNYEGIEQSDKETPEKNNSNTGREKASLSQKINTEHNNSNKLNSDTGDKDKSLSRQSNSKRELAKGTKKINSKSKESNSKTISKKNYSETGKFNLKDDNQRSSNLKNNSSKDKYTKTNSTELVALQTDTLKMSDIGGPSLLAFANNMSCSSDNLFMLSNVPLNQKRTLTVIGLASIEESQNQESGTKGEVGEKTGDQDKNDDSIMSDEDTSPEEETTVEEDSTSTEKAAEDDTSAEEASTSTEEAAEDDTSAEEVSTGQEDSTEEAEEIEPEVHPAQTFQAQTKHLNISVEAPEGSLPEGTVMRVREVTNQKTIDAITKTVEEAEESNGQGIGTDEKDSRDQEALTDENTSQGETSEDKEDGSAGSGKKEKSKKSEKADKKARKKEVLKVQAVDITFTDKEGNEIEPLQPIHVTISSKLVDEAAKHDGQEITAVHIDGDGNGSIMETETKKDKISFDADAFSVYAVVNYAQISQTVISASGETYKITVTYGEDAKIPDGAELKVREILPGDEEYDSLYSQAAEEACSDAGKQDIEMPILSGAHLFDIEIQGKDGKIEPSAPVQVNIRLVGTGTADHTALVHFGKSGTEALKAQAVESKTNQIAVTEVDFKTDAFSVYSVVNVTDFGSLVNGNQKYALVSGIAGDPGATTGYSETWGQDYFTIIVNAHAMSDQYFYDGQNRVDGFRVEPVHAYEDGSISYVGGNPAQWQFESAGNGKYYLSVNGKYIQRFDKANSNNPYGWEARLTDNRNNAAQLSITVNSDGTILIYDDLGGGQRYYLHNDGNGEWSTRVFKFTNQNVNTNSAAYRFRVCRESDQFDSFAARKVSVQNLTVNDSFLIYRKFEDSQGNEQLFALASDGTFVRVYDGGDTLYWRETDKNIYWNYRLEGNYYSIYSTNPLTNETVYINPMHSSDPPQTITNTPSRLTLIGKENGNYGTAIENWDQTAYDYAGLHVTVNGQGQATLSTGTRVAGTSDEFLFAVASTMPGQTAETVDTVDSDSLGIKITMFDYGQAKGSYSAGDKLSEMTAVAGSAEYTPHAAHALVKAYLENGLPSSTTNGAMSELFTGNGSAVTAYKENVNHLFLQSYYDENGMFRYRSEDNYAYLPFDADTGTITGTDFTVYRQAATPYPEDVSPGHTYYTHGHYMPFNDIDMTQNVSRLMNQYGNDYQNGQALGELPVGDGRSYEDIYGVQGIPNFYTGMKMEANFTQLKDGKMDNGDPMVFKFTGDDDMWVYIDGVLVLDIGGIHEPLSGSIDFSTGKVNNPTGSSLAGEKTLYDIFMAVRDATGTPQSVKDKINTLTWVDVNNDNKPDTFADYTKHDFKAFYMERGAGASNLDIQFNLKVVRPDEFVVEKQIPEGIDTRFVNQEYKFQATFKDYKDNDIIKPLFKNQTDQTNDIVCNGVYYKDRKDENGNPIEVLVDTDGYFTLKAGEAAVFKIADQKIEYTVNEVEIDSGQTEKVEINGQVVTVSSGTAEAAYAKAGDRSQLNYKNHPFLQNLNIIKHLLPENTQAGTGDVFEFRVYLETTIEQDGEQVRQLVPYSYGPYYVTKEVGGQIHYYTLTGANNTPQDKGTTPVVCSTTGRSGSINSIPPEYTVVIPNLAVGTHFYIEERRDNIPAGYVFDHEDLIEGTYDVQTLGSDQDIISRILARDEKDHQSFDHDTIGKIKKDVDARSEVFNKKVNVNVQKQWLKTNGAPYTLEEARQLPGSTNAVITAELWKKKIVQEQSEATDESVTVTFKVNTTTDNTYRQVSEPVTVKKNSTLEFSLGANKTSQAQEIHTEPAYTISRSSVSSNPKIHYSNGRQKDKWSKYTISDITKDITVYATFDAEKVSDDFVGLYIASMEEPGSSVAPVEEKVADITLNNGNDWLQQVPLESGYTYFLMNVAETGLEEHAHEYTFVDTPVTTTDANGNMILSVSNKYREPIDVTVEKVWSPPLANEEENNAYIKVELHRYAKKTKGILEVVLKDNYGAPIEGAVFKLYKDNAEQDQEYVTDVNGKVIASDLEAGTYFFKQKSTPEGYSMTNSPPQTQAFVVYDNKTERQESIYQLQNQALETNGVATLTLRDNNGDPIQGAKYNLIKKEGSRDVVVKEGLETNENGKITVSQLKAGTYYFYETESPADYKLPDDWQDTDFTVLEHPGVVQTFNLNMTNYLKGKGYVDIVLTGPDNRLISGASFELYKDNEKLEEGTTDNEGKLTFGNHPDRLHDGTYIVKQITTDPDLLPANQQAFTIYDNGNTNQKNELTFTNPYRGMGTATVTLTRKDNNQPIAGADFELYKDGELLVTKTTDDNGQIIFGDPVKLPAGNYSIKQISTSEALEPVVNSWPFTIEENGDPNQSKSWNLQNEENAGNVTIKLWRKQGSGQWNWNLVNTYTALKPGHTYSFTATVDVGLYTSNNIWYYQDESDHNSYDSISQDQMNSLNQDGWSNGTYHFTITPENDNTIYSYVLVSGWGLDNIRTMEMDDAEGASANTGMSTAGFKKAVSAYQPMMKVMKNSVQVRMGTNISDSDQVSDSLQSGEGNNKVLKAQTRNAAATPSGPPNADYIEDSTFVETYKITKADNNWKHVFKNLDKCDLEENPYYYYVVETECVPDSYHVASYGNNNLTDTGTIKITNEKRLGALTIEKRVTVNNGDVPDNAKTIADGTYTFTITGPENYSETRTITVTNGVAESNIVLTELKEGDYTIRETGSTNTNGISLAQDQTITVNANSQASTNVAQFTNNLATASIKIIKVEKGHKDSSHTLAGAKFQLTRVDENGNIISGSGAYQSEIQTVDPDTGKTTFSGLFPGSRYKLEEKEAPAGYVLVETPWYFTADANGKATLTATYTMASAADNDNSFYIENEPGAALPMTGGPGTNLIYLFGIMLTGLACTGLVVKRRKEKAA